MQQRRPAAPTTSDLGEHQRAGRRHPPPAQQRRRCRRPRPRAPAAGPGTGPTCSAKPCQDSSATQVVTAATTASTGSVARARRVPGPSGADRQGRRAPVDSLASSRRAAAVGRDRAVRPSSCQTVSSRSRGPQRDGPPALLGQQAGRRAAGRRRRRRARRRRRGRPPAREPAWWCIRRSTGRSAGRRRRARRRSARRAPASASQPVSRRGRWTRLHDGERLEQRAGVEVGVAVVPGAAGSSPAAVTSRTVKPRWLRCTAIDAAAETAASSEEAMPWPRWALEPVVEEERRARLPRLLLAAHHQLAHAWPSCASARGAGRRRGGTRGR